MSDVLVTIAVLIVFTLVGGFFSAAETALVSLRESQVVQLESSSARTGRRLASLLSNPNRFLAAVQVGVTMAGFLSAGFGASRIVPKLTPWLTKLGLSEGVATTVAFLAITLAIAYVSLVLGELVPKRIALQRTEQVALGSARIVDVTATLASPFIWALSVSTNLVVRLLGLDPSSGRVSISGEELRGIVASQTSLSDVERELIDDVFAAGDRELSEVMIPRTEVAFLDASMPVFTAARQVNAMPHSRYPVVRGSADDVVGFVHVRDLLAPDRVDRSIRLAEIAREVLRLPDSKRLLPTLQMMREHQAHLAIVVDEYGGTAGIVTLEDLVEELIGEIEDEYDAARSTRLPKDMLETEVAGLLHLDEFFERTGVAIPEGPYETVAGFVMARLGRLPRLGDLVSVPTGVLEVLELDGLRIAKLRVTPGQAAVASSAQ